MLRRTPSSTLFPYTTLFRPARFPRRPVGNNPPAPTPPASRSEEHTSELQSHSDLVCRLLLEKKKKCSRPRAWRLCFLNAAPHTELYTLSLHDALPTCPISASSGRQQSSGAYAACE